MEFHVAKLMQEPIGSTRTATIDHDFPVQHADVRLTRVRDARDAVLVQFTGNVAVEQECARCLVPYGTVVPVEFEELYYRRPDERDHERGRDEDVPKDPDAFYIGERNVIDISEAVRQYRELSASLQPLCRDDCPGLCAECGADLTMWTCNCDPTPIDPRMAALAALKRPSEG